MQNCHCLAKYTVPFWKIIFNLEVSCIQLQTTCPKITCNCNWTQIHTLKVSIPVEGAVGLETDHLPPEGWLPPSPEADSSHWDQAARQEVTPCCHHRSHSSTFQSLFTIGSCLPCSLISVWINTIFSIVRNNKFQTKLFDSILSVTLLEPCTHFNHIAASVQSDVTWSSFHSIGPLCGVWYINCEQSLRLHSTDSRTILR